MRRQSRRERSCRTAELRNRLHPVRKLRGPCGDAVSRWEDLVGEFHTMWLDRQLDFDMAQMDCTSPIEKVFLACAMGEMGFEEIRGSQERFDRAMDVLDAAGVGMNEAGARPFWSVLVTAEDERLILSSQPTLVLDGRRIRPDFTLLTGPAFDGGCRVSVELDGHDFHERTPEQAERDKSKDRLLQKHGWIALRFTGREVLRDPSKCMQEVLAHSYERIRAQVARDKVSE